MRVRSLFIMQIYHAIYFAQFVRYRLIILANFSSISKVSNNFQDRTTFVNNITDGRLKSYSFFKLLIFETDLTKGRALSLSFSHVVRMIQRVGGHVAPVKLTDRSYPERYHLSRVSKVSRDVLKQKVKKTRKYFFMVKKKIKKKSRTNSRKSSSYFPVRE